MPTLRRASPSPPERSLEFRRQRAAWQAKRLLAEAAAQLGDVVHLSAFSQQEIWRAALHNIEQVRSVLADIAVRPLRSRRYRYSPQWRRRFASLLRQQRESRGISRQQLAERSKVSVTTIRNIETLRSHPELGTIEQLLSVPELGLSWEDLEPLDL